MLLGDVPSSEAYRVTAEPTRMLAVFGIKRPASAHSSSSLMPTIVNQIEEALRSNWVELGLTDGEPISSQKLNGVLSPAHLLLTFKEARGLLHFYFHYFLRSKARGTEC